MLENVRIVLVEPTHPGNIGAAARAMKTMGISHLFLVNPQCELDQRATQMAAGADDLLQTVCVVGSLSEALRDVEYAYATSARQRSLEWPLCSPRECAEQAQASLRSAPVAFVFGREHAGLTNDELAVCQSHVHINTNEAFSSLNLAAAVQVICYELRVADQSSNSPVSLPDDSEVSDPGEAWASGEEVVHFMNSLENVLVHLSILDPKHPKLLMRRLYRLFHRSRLKKNEINILRGIFKAILNK